MTSATLRPARAALWFHRILYVLGLGFLAWMVLYICSPLAQNLSAYGGHDWDVSTAFRYLVVKSLRVYGQFPFWNPYIAGGYTNWGYIESATIVVSPFLPVYLLFDLRTALRLEVVLCAAFAVAGTWCFVGRFTRSTAARVFACIVFALNGRWALQAAMGHTWHLYFAWLPWTLYFLERAPGWSGAAQGKKRYACIAGAFIALMIYNGAHYPLIHTLVVMGLYALARAVLDRSLRPVLSATLAGSVALGLAAPRLLPILDGMSKAPRLVESKEWMDLGVFLHTLTSPSQRSGDEYVRVSQWGWHEWGSYIGWPAFLLLVAGVVLARGPRARHWKWAAAVLLLLSFGNFHQYSPWNQLHRLPVFDSLHVPSRWQYSALLLCGVLAAISVEQVSKRREGRRIWLETLLFGAVVFVGIDVAGVSRSYMENSFWMRLDPRTRHENDGFYQMFKPPPGLDYLRRDWGIPTLPAIVANVGLIENTTIGGMNVYVADPSGKVRGVGAIGRDQPGYRGEVFTASGAGSAEYLRWSPNQLVVRVRGVKPGETVIVNQNFDPGWRANGRATFAHADRIAFSVQAGDEEVQLIYRPRRWPVGLALCGATIASLAAAFWFQRRRTRRAAA